LAATGGGIQTTSGLTSTASGRWRLTPWAMG
jgi:hypothetical protein